MGIRVDCPHCGKAGEAPHERAGKKAKCPHCSGIMLIPIPEASFSPVRQAHEASPVMPAQQLPQTTSGPIVRNSYSVRERVRRQRSSPIISSFLMLLMSLGGVALGYFTLHALGVFDRAIPKPTIVTSQPRQATKRIEATPEVIVPEPVLIPQIEPRTLAPLLNEKRIEYPAHISLPDTSDVAIHALTELSDDSEWKFVSADDRLSLESKTLRFSTEGDNFIAVAGLATLDSKLSFRWLDKSSEEAVSAVQNAMVIISSGGGEAAIAMRTPETAEPFEVKFDKPLLRLAGTCNMPPDPNNVFIELQMNNSFPPFRIDGHDSLTLGNKDELIIWYNNIEGVGTKVKAEKRGNVLAVDFITRYRLPSGDEGSLTISNGRKKRKEIESLLNSADAASEAINTLTRQQSTLQTELSNWQHMNTIVSSPSGRVESPVLVARKLQGIKLTNARLRAVNNDITRAQRLIADRPAIIQELDALNAISEFTHNLKTNGSIGYRFFTVIDGHEVTLTQSE